MISSEKQTHQNQRNFKEQTIQPLVSMSLELLLFPCRPPVMVLHNRLQSHCHVNRCRCNRASHYDQYRSMLCKMHAARAVLLSVRVCCSTFFSSKRQRPLSIPNALSTTDLAALSFLLNSRSSGGRCPLFGYGLTSHFSSG